MSLVETFRYLFAQVPDLLQPLSVAVAGAIPFVEGAGGAAIGVLVGVHPAVAIAAGALGNFICVAILVYASASARSAVVSRQRGRRAQLQADESRGPAVELLAPREDADERTARRSAKFQHAFERYGVPGVSLLGPMLLPTHLTATMLAAAGLGRGRVLFWQAPAITGWTVLVGLIVTGVIAVGPLTLA